TSSMGYLHVPIAPAPVGSAQANSLLTKLQDPTYDGVAYGSSDGGRWKNASYPLENVGETPMEGSLQTANSYFNGGTAQPAAALPFDSRQGGPAAQPAVSSCTKNFAVFLTDGLPSLRPNALSGDINSGVVTAAKNLLQSDAKVSTYFIGFGSEAAGASALNTFAAAGGTGNAYSASDQASLDAAFATIFSNIASTSSAAAAVAANSTQLTTDTYIYQATYDPANWGGHLLAYQINPSTGAMDGTPAWDSAATGKITGGASRNVYTMLPAFGQGAEFTAAGIAPDPHVAAWLLNRASPIASNYVPAEPNYYGAGGANVSLMINYLKGDHANEAPSGTAPDSYRARSNLLGDIANSAAVYAARASMSYPPTLEPAPAPAYSTFVTSTTSRTPMLYVGANDGMLHAFRADTGAEMFAYIPGVVLPNLPLLADPASSTMSHHYFVDGSPTVSDVYFGGQWRTVLVGGLNAGGQGIYALDVTNPGTFGAGSVLWEFTDRNTITTGPLQNPATPMFDTDLGYTFSQPSIARVRAATASGSHWVAIFGNGYGNMDDDGSPSATGNAVLYVVDLQTGQLIKKFDTGYGWAQAVDYKANGLSTPAPVDVDGDGNVEYVYAGDLQGHMWKFDISSDSPSEWNVAFSGAPVLGGVSGTTASCAPAQCSPLYTAKTDGGAAQPITAKPDVGPGPTYYGGQMVYFGSGKSFEDKDNLLTTTNTVYGVWDNNTAAVAAPSTSNRNMMVGQVIDEVTDVILGSRYRLTTTNTVNWQTQRGWYMDLPETGEKVTGNFQINSNRLIFVTNTPSVSTDQCSAGGTSWLMDIDPLTGGPLQNSPFDVNQDGHFDDSDKFTHHGLLQSASGVQSVPVNSPGGGGDPDPCADSLLSSPIIMNADGFQIKIFNSNTGKACIKKERPGAGDQRQSWRDLSAQ
ncbi:MAG: PilC/PilY family type IV pilus protein, partial [Desulfovibrionaceae bacterium]|nr:PilC/PilY family type IV pilus protein [Desulfovibrionaceae bacterium]